MCDFHIRQTLMLYSLDYPDPEIEIAKQLLLSAGDESFGKVCWSRV